MTKKNSLGHSKLCCLKIFNRIYFWVSNILYVKFEKKRRKESEGQHFLDVNFRVSSVYVGVLSLRVRMLVSLAGLSIPRLAYLLQLGVRDAIAGKAEVRHGRVELLEEQSKGPISGSTIRQYVGDLLTDALQEDRLGDVAPHKLTHSCQICRTEGWKITQQTNFKGW